MTTIIMGPLPNYEYSVVDGKLRIKYVGIVRDVLIEPHTASGDATSSSET